MIGGVFIDFILVLKIPYFDEFGLVTIHIKEKNVILFKV
jgi:hypothetical protein